jgi:WD40 repeat protein
MCPKGRTVVILVLVAAASAGCAGLSDGDLDATTVLEAPLSTRPATNPLFDNTPTPDTAAQRPISSPQPAPSQMPAFKLPEGDEPGWLLVAPPERSESIRMAFSADSRRLAVSTGRPRIDFYDMASGERVNTLSYEPTIPVGIMDLALTPDGSELVVASRGRIDVWDIGEKTLRVLTRDPKLYQFGTYGVIELSPDGAFLAAGPVFDPSGDTSVMNTEIWETETWTRKWVFRDALAVFSFSPDGKSLATLSGPGVDDLFKVPTTPVIWDLVTGARREFPVDGLAMTVGYRSDGVTLAINTWEFMAGQPRGVRATLLLDTATGKVRRTITNSHVPLDLSFSSDGKLLAVLYDNAQIVVWNIEAGEQALVVDAVSRLPGPVFSPDGRLLATVPRDGRILFWNVPGR